MRPAAVPYPRYRAPTATAHLPAATRQTPLGAVVAAGAGGAGARATTGAGAGLAGAAGTAGVTAWLCGCVVTGGTAAAGAGADLRAGLGVAPTLGTIAGTGAVGVTGPSDGGTVIGRSGIASTMVSATGAGGGSTGAAMVGGAAGPVVAVVAGACAIRLTAGASDPVLLVAVSVFAVPVVAGPPVAGPPVAGAVVTEVSDTSVRDALLLAVGGRFAAARTAVNPNMPDTASPATAIRAPPATWRLRGNGRAVRRVGEGRTGPADAEDVGGAQISRWPSALPFCGARSAAGCPRRLRSAATRARFSASVTAAALGLAAMTLGGPVVDFVLAVDVVTGRSGR